MKRTGIPIVILMSFSFLPPVTARADLSMMILSETYHVSGYVSRGDHEDPSGTFHPGEYQSYDLTVPSPGVSDTVSIWADTWDGSLTATSTATRYESGGHAHFHVEAFSTRIGPGGLWPEYSIDKDAYARLDVQFKFIGSADQLRLDVLGDIMYSGGTGRLARADGQSWLLYDGISFVSEDIVWWDVADLIPVDTEQIYTLSMDVYPWAAGEGGSLRTVTFMDVSGVSVVPAPGAAILGLLGLAGAGLGLRRRSN